MRGPASRLGDAVWGLLTSVDFAVLQIIVLALFAVVGMTLRQLPGFAFRSPTDYADEMAKLHALYDPSLGVGVVDALERLQLFQVFTSTWFSVGLVVLILSIVACTIDRLPRLWRQSADIRVVQADPYYDPQLPDRALMAGVDADAAAGSCAATGSSCVATPWTAPRTCTGIATGGSSSRRCSRTSA